VCHHLGFGRVAGVYCIHIDSTAYHKDDYGDFNREVGSGKKAWSDCDRETRLAAFQKLPELISNLVTKAQGWRSLRRKSPPKSES
jgi:hypothetical protein